MAMSKLQALLDEQIKAGKSDAEIAAVVVEEKAAPGLDGTEIVEAIHGYKTLLQAQAALDAAKDKSDQKASESELEKKVDEAVDAKLKSINIDPARKYGDIKEAKRFNPNTGKMEVIDAQLSDAYKAFTNQLVAIGRQDFDSAHAISQDIDKENDRKMSFALGYKATPTVSDVTTRGSYAVPTEVDSTIMQLIYAASEVYMRCNKQVVNYNSKVFPVMNTFDVSYVADQSTGLAEKNPVFSNPTVNLYRVGGYSTISNLFLEQKGDLIDAFIRAYAGSFARFIDLHIVSGNVTSNADKVDGIIFDPNTSLPTPIARSALSLAALAGIKNTLSASVDLKQCVWIANRLVSDQIGLMETTGGHLVFPGYVNGQGSAAPFGIPWLVNPQIPSTLDVGGDSRTSGGDDALVLADMSKVIVGISGDTRIDISDHAFFTDDLFAIRCIKKFGQKVASSTSTAGIVAVAQELTNS